MTNSKSKAVAKKKEPQMPAVMDDIYNTAGEGTQYDSSEMIIPFLRIAQGLSPQTKKLKPEYIEGLKEGDLFNTVTGEYWAGGDGVHVIPCYQVTKFLEFVPRDQGGGFKGELAANNPDLQNTTRVGPKEILPNGNELSRSDQHYCIMIDKDEIPQMVIVDMKSTMLKVSRRWKTKIAMQKIRHPQTGVLITPAVFATVWHLKSVAESNDQGDWFNYSVEKVGLVEDREIFAMAKDFRNSIVKGEVKAQEEPQPGASGGQANTSYVQDGTQPADDEIPF